MKRSLLLTAAATLILSSALASGATLSPCDESDMEFFNSEIAEVVQDGYAVKYMRNKAGKLVGFFAFGKGDQDARAQVCSFDIRDDETVASSWYYWDRELGTPNPARWREGKKLAIYQDEGFLNMRVLKASKTGDVTLALAILGTDEDAAPAVRDTVKLSDSR